MAFQAYLRKACTRLRIVILLDAVNQFDSMLHLARLQWLPQDVPDSARFILSSLDASALEESHRLAPKPREIELKPLTTADGEAIIKQFCKRYRKNFEPDQRAGLLAKADAGTPLYLLAALEELRTLGNYEEIDRRIAELPATTQELFRWILRRLENDDGFRNSRGQPVGHELVPRFAVLLATSRYGLSHRELTDLLERGDQEGNVAALIHLLRPYLMRRGELLDFYHSQFREAATESCLNTDERRHTAHIQLADYFQSQHWWHDSPEEIEAHAKQLPLAPRPANLRKIDELPYHLLRAVSEAAGSWGPAQRRQHDAERVEDLFLDWHFLEAKSEAGQVFDLGADLRLALKILPEECSRYRLLRLLEKAIRRDIQFIARRSNDFPQALFQCLWNSAWWQDCSEAASYFNLADDQTGNLSCNHTGPKLSDLLTRWRHAKEQESPGFAWLRANQPPREDLDSDDRATFCYCHEREITCVTYSPDGLRIATGSLDHTVRSWDAATGEELLCLKGHDDSVWSVAISPNGRWIASGSFDNTVAIWNATTGRMFWRINVQDAVHGVAFSPGSNYIAAGSEDGNLRIFDVDRGNLLAVLKGHEGAIESVAFAPQGDWIASGSSNGGVRLWDLNRGEPLAILPPLDKIKSIAISPDGRQIAAGTEKGVYPFQRESRIHLWDVATKSLTASFTGHESDVVSVAFSPDGSTLASGSWDRTVRLWDVQAHRFLIILSHHSREVRGVAFSPCGRWVASVGDDLTLQVSAVQGTRRRSSPTNAVPASDNRAVGLAADDHKPVVICTKDSLSSTARGAFGQPTPGQSVMICEGTRQFAWFAPPFGELSISDHAKLAGFAPEKDVCIAVVEGNLGHSSEAHSVLVVHPSARVDVLEALDYFSRYPDPWGAAERLRSDGRILDAIKVSHVGHGSMAVKGKPAPGDEAIACGNLSELFLLAGEIQEALTYAQRSVEFADRSGSLVQRISKRTTLACVMHQAGLTEKAAGLFREAEVLQRRLQPEYSILYLLSGFRYCDFLLDQGDYNEVRRRAHTLLNWRSSSDSPVDIALDHLIMARALLSHGSVDGSGEQETQISHARFAVEMLRLEGRRDWLPPALLALSGTYAAWKEWGRAEQTVSEALSISESGAMLLYLADSHLSSAELHLALGRNDQARFSVTAAQRIIDQKSYRRRKCKLQDLQVRCFPTDI